MPKLNIEILNARLEMRAEPGYAVVVPSPVLKIVLPVLALLLASCDVHKATPAASSAASEPMNAVSTAAPNPLLTTAAVPLTKEQWLSRIESTYTRFSESDEGDGVTKFNACFGALDSTRKKCPAEFASAKRDGFRKLRLYKPGFRNSFTLDSYVHSYISLADGERPRVIVAPYYFSKRGWLFLHNVAFLADGDVVFEKDFAGSDVRRNNSEIGIEERADFLVTGNDLDHLRKVAGARVLKIRMTGEKGYISLDAKTVDTIKNDFALLLKINDRMVNALDDK